MAKSNKSDLSKSVSSAGGGAAPPPKKGARGKGPAPAGALAGSQLIDTNLAAQSVARVVSGMARAGDAPSAGANPRESGSFKQMKQNLFKPAGQTIGDVLGASPGMRKSNMPAMHGGPEKQKAHSQTQGGSRINVPRRTAG